MHGIKNTEEDYFDRIRKLNEHLEITGYYNTYIDSKLHIKCKTCGYEWDSTPKTFRGVKHCKKCSSRKTENPNVTHNEFLELMKEKYPSIKITGHYSSASKSITCECLDCGNKEKIHTTTLVRGTYKCRICNYNKENIIVGKNDIKTINPVLYDCLKDKLINEKYSINSRNKTTFICPSCGNELYKTITHVHKRGLKCKCQDGNSLGEKYFFNVIKSVDPNVQIEINLNNNLKYRYDFFGEVNGLKWICEIQGKQHSIKSFETCGGRTLAEEIQNDKDKKEYALNNGIDLYIQLDSKNSGFTYLKNKILESKLSQIYDFSLVDWVKCYKNSLMSDVFVVADLWNKGMKVMEIANKLNIAKSTVRAYLTKCNDIGYCKYDHTRSNKKRIMCIETGEIFNSLREAEIKYNIHRGYLSDYFKGKKHSTIGKYTWKLYE